MARPGQARPGKVRAAQRRSDQTTKVKARRDGQTSTGERRPSAPEGMHCACRADCFLVVAYVCPAPFDYVEESQSCLYMAEVNASFVDAESSCLALSNNTGGLLELRDLAPIDYLVQLIAGILSN